MLSNTLAIVLLVLILATCFIVLLSLLCLRRHRRQRPQQRSRQLTQPQPQRRPSEPQSRSSPSSFDKDLEANIVTLKNPPHRPRPAHLNLNHPNTPATPQRTSRYGLKELEAGLDLSPLPASSSLSPRTPNKSPLGSPLLSPRDADAGAGAGAGRKSWRLSALSIMSGRSRDGEDGKRKSRISSWLPGGGRRNRDREEVRLTYFAW